MGAAAVETEFCVSAKTTLEALYEEERARPGSVVVLNFASAKNPGGGFKKGSSAQEESLARSSTLYGALRRFDKGFYAWNRRHPGTYSHRIIYSPRITFLKQDDGTRLAEEATVQAAVVTCPAVNVGVAKASAAECEEL